MCTIQANRYKKYKVKLTLNLWCVIYSEKNMKKFSYEEENPGGERENPLGKNQSR